MIDLKKPLEGAPGLLLMAFLLLLGAAIGLGVAILLLWIPMSDAFANFLGGVVGAGLGAALAVMGAVYVQRQDNRGRLNSPINRLVSEINDLLLQLNVLRFAADAPEGVSFEASGRRKKAVANLISDVRATLSA